MDNKVGWSPILDHYRTNTKHSFTGSAGQAIISKTAAYLITDSRYWHQAEQELDENWTLIRVGMPSGPQNWVDWISVSFRLVL
jgi:Creatinase/Prolidase N-terminal domain